MNDTTIKKVQSAHLPVGKEGEIFLVSGKKMAMRLWKEEPGENSDDFTTREYETVGYVIDGKAELESEGQIVKLEAGDSWLVPSGARHRYKIVENFTAVEATSPPARLHK